MTDLLSSSSPKAPSSNVPELSVSELALSLKRTLEETYGRVRVRGELSKVKIHSSGHLYSDLKDADSVLNIVCWRSTVEKLSLRPEEGLDVICTGKITSYPARSNYQMIVDRIELAGEGALLKMLEDRKKRLAAEGLFDEGRKKRLPFLPRVIGVVTSPTGAVIRDILHRVEDRFPVHVIVWPVRVQGEGAAEEIESAIRGFNALGPDSSVPRPDLLIVARGGGSLEDLMPFNDEKVVRAAASSAIPLISAVGHETDTTLIDYAADLRAPTPTAAAELALPERLALLAHTQSSGERLSSLLMRQVGMFRQQVGHLAARLGDPQRFLDLRTQSLDHASDRLLHALERHLGLARERFLRASGRLSSPLPRLEMAAQMLGHKAASLARAGEVMIDKRSDKIAQAARMMEVLSFKSVLGRGFALVRDAAGAPLSARASLSAGDLVQVEFHDGVVKTRVEDIS